MAEYYSEGVDEGEDTDDEDGAMLLRLFFKI